MLVDHQYRTDNPCGEGSRCDAVPCNPHIKYFEGDRRGYMKAAVTRNELRVDLRFMTSVENQAGSGYTELATSRRHSWRRVACSR